MTILGGNYKPVEVKTLDLVGYTGKEFVILNHTKSLGRKLPPIPEMMASIPWCIRCKVENNQIVNFGGQVATLHDIDGIWHLKLRQQNSEPKPLPLFTFFEIGNCK
ncbi:MAG: hypothetical protein Q7S12_04285 [bacterium]|nr:hypothetical protein [bacterium]